MKNLIGTVVSNKTPKTAIVEITRSFQHPLYKKFIKKSRRLAVQVDEDVSEGNRVRLIQTRPLSKTKRYKVVKIIK